MCSFRTFVVVGADPLFLAFPGGSLVVVCGLFDRRAQVVDQFLSSALQRGTVESVRFVDEVGQAIEELREVRVVCRVAERFG